MVSARASVLTPPRLALAGAIAAWMAVYVTAHGLMSRAARWYVPLNDYWPIRHFAERMDPGDLRTVGQGFYPVGAFLWTVWPAVPERDLVLANLAVTALLAGACAAVAYRAGGAFAAVGAAVILTLDPRWSHYVGCQTADIAAAAVFGLGVALLLASWSAARARTFVVAAGLLLGVAATTRYHFGPASIVLLVSWAACTSQARHALVGLAAYAPLPLAQWLINRAAGVSVQRAQLFNVNKTIHDVNWYEADAVQLPGSLLELLLADPLLSIRQVAWMLSDVAPWAAVCVVSALVVRDSRWHRPLVALGAFAVGYSVLVALGSSHRSALALVPVAALVGSIAVALRMEGAGRVLRAAALGALVVLLGGPTIGTMWREQVTRTRHAAELATLAEVIRTETGVDDGRQVYTTDGATYLPGFHPAFPNVPAGWQRFDLYGFRNEYPDICADTPECFVATLRATGIRVVVLNPQARYVSGALDGLRQRPTSAPGLVPVGALGASVVFRVADP